MLSERPVSTGCDDLLARQLRRAVAQRQASATGGTLLQRMLGSSTDLDLPEGAPPDPIAKMVLTMSEIVNRASWEGAPCVMGKKKVFKKDIDDRKQFSLWLTEKVEIPTAMNCYSAVLYAAFLAKQINKDAIWAALQLEQYDEGSSFGSIPIFLCNIINKANKGQRVETPQNRKDGLLAQVPSGNIVVFGMGGHVALSRGKRQILELDKSTRGESTIDAAISRGGSAYETVRWGPLEFLGIGGEQLT